MAFLGIALLVSCGGGSSHAGATDAGKDAGTTDGGTSFPTTTTQSGTVQLPAGVIVPLQSLTVQGSLANVAVSSSGAFSITTYSPGAQLVAVLSPSGNPMLMGWLDASDTIINAESTAEVLLWFGAGAPNLPADARQTALAALAATPGLDGVTQAIETGLLANPDTFANPNQPLTDALTQVLEPIRQGMPGTVLVADVLVQPGADSPQSGLSVLQDPPYSAHVTNAFRRRAWAFVQRVSETTGTTVTPDPMDITDFEVTPILGLNQGINGTVANIMNVWYGTATAIGAPVDSPRDLSTNMTLPFSVPSVDNADKTTYTVTIVGAGLSTGPAFGSLTPAQSAKITEIAVRSISVDALLPFLTNVIFGIPGLIPNGAFLNNLAKNVAKDLLNAFPKLAPSIVSGDWNSVFATLNQAFGAPSSTWRGLVVDDITLAIQQTPGGAGLSYSAAGAANLVKTINTYITVSGLVLQAVDSRWFISSIAQSDQADAWTLDVTPSKVTLNPSTSTTSVGQMVTLAASVLGVEDLTGYSFQWTNTENGGDLLQVGAGSQTTSMMTPSFCASVTQGASTAQVNYLASTSGTTDTVTVEAFSGPNCAPATSIDVATATVNVTLTPTIDPACQTIAPGGMVQMSAGVDMRTDLTGFSFKWHNTATAGTLSPQANTAPATDFCTAGPNAVYQALHIAATLTDTVTVEVWSGSACTGTSLGTATSRITVGSSTLTVSVNDMDLCPEGWFSLLNTGYPSALYVVAACQTPDYVVAGSHFAGAAIGEVLLTWTPSWLSSWQRQNGFAHMDCPGDAGTSGVVMTSMPTGMYTVSGAPGSLRVSGTYGCTNTFPAPPADVADQVIAATFDMPVFCQ